jgi:hypothetical protein
MHVIFMAYAHTLDKSPGSSERTIKASVENRNGLALRAKLKLLAKPITANDIRALNIDRGDELRRIEYDFEEFGVMQYFASFEAKLVEFDQEDPTGGQRPREWGHCRIVADQFRSKNRRTKRSSTGSRGMQAKETQPCPWQCYRRGSRNARLTTGSDRPGRAVHQNRKQKLPIGHRLRPTL